MYLFIFHEQQMYHHLSEPLKTSLLMYQGIHFNYNFQHYLFLIEFELYL
jgi:hypothetical protein